MTTCTQSSSSFTGNGRDYPYMFFLSLQCKRNGSVLSQLLINVLLKLGICSIYFYHGMFVWFCRKSFKLGSFCIIPIFVDILVYDKDINSAVTVVQYFRIHMYRRYFLDIGFLHSYMLNFLVYLFKYLY